MGQKHNQSSSEKVKKEKVNTEQNVKTEICEIFKCSVSDCTREFSSKYQLEKHIELMDHEGDFFFSCAKCPKKFASSLGLKIHGRDSCDDTASERETLVKEENRLEEEMSDETDDYNFKNNEFKFSCDLCDKFLSSEENLGIHKLIHKEMGRFACKEKDC